MKTYFSTERFAVVDDGCPGLKIYDKVVERVDTFNFGAFYDNMGGNYPANAVEAAKMAIAHREAEIDKWNAEFDERLARKRIEKST